MVSFKFMKDLNVWYGDVWSFFGSSIYSFIAIARNPAENGGFVDFIIKLWLMDF